MNIHQIIIIIILSINCVKSVKQLQVVWSDEFTNPKITDNWIIANEWYNNKCLGELIFLTK